MAIYKYIKPHSVHLKLIQPSVSTICLLKKRQSFRTACEPERQLRASCLMSYGGKKHRPGRARAGGQAQPCPYQFSGCVFLSFSGHAAQHVGSSLTKNRD